LDRTTDRGYARAFPSSRFPGEIPFAFYDFSRRYGQENFRSAFGADFAVSLRERERPDDSLARDDPARVSRRYWPWAERRRRFQFCI
jgi:hypothetical protein